MAPFAAATASAAAAAAAAAALLLGAAAPAARAIPAQFRGVGAIRVSLVVVGDWGRQGADQDPAARENQTRVAAGMATFAENQANLGAAWFPVSVGDNFYQNGLINGDHAEFTESFTNVYSAPVMQGKRWDVIMGNHDFRGNISAQFDSVAQLKDARWHAALFEIANYTSADESVIVWAVHIDTNVLISDYLYCPGTHTYDFQGIGGPPFARSDSVSSYRASVEAWRAGTLARIDDLLARAAESMRLSALQGKTTWLLAFGHHPIRSHSHHGDSIDLLNDVDELLWKHGVDAYINGHDHDLQLITRPYCCAVDEYTLGGNTLAEFLADGFDEDVRCIAEGIPTAKYTDPAAAPYFVPDGTSVTLPNQPKGRDMLYITTGAGSETRQSSHPDEPLPEQDAYGSFFHPGPGFLTVEAEGFGMRFVLRDAEAAELHHRVITKT